MVKSALVASVAVLLAASACAVPARTGNIEDGKKAWGLALRCQNCHGSQAEGGFGPDLAGRGLSYEQFRRAVREPWGMMLAYQEKQLSDRAIADMWAYTSGLPKVAQPGKKHYTAPPGAPLGQVYLVDTIGCANCHEPELRQPRKVLGGEAADVDFDYFAKRIYEHQEIYPTGRMGNYTRTRVPEAVLREVYKFVKEDLGLLIPMQANLAPGTASGANSTHTLTIKNNGTAGKGLSAEDVTVSLKLPDGAKVADSTGAAVATSSGGAATWKLAKILSEEELKYTVTIAGAPRPVAELIKGSRVDWMKPGMRMGVPNLELEDERWLGSKNDWQPIGAGQPGQGGPPPPAPAR